MLIIVGLGNPGEKYQNSRHNVGFKFIDYLIENLQIPNPKSQIPNKFQISNIKIQKNLSSIIYHLTSNVILVKPQTFMNKSGEAVSKIIKNEKLKMKNLVIVHDDLDIPLGKFKIQKGTGPRLHNGLESIEQYLKTKDFWRIRIGVDNRTTSPERSRRVDGETYVLQNFHSPETDILINEIFPKAFNRLKSLLMSHL